MLNKVFPETKVKNGKHKNKCKVRLIVSETVSYFQEQLLQESWENVFSTEDVNSSSNKFLNTFLIIFEASFPYIYLSNDGDKGWILFVCLLYIQSIHTWSKPQDIEFVITNYIS